MYVLKRENSGLTLGVIQTGSQNQRNPNAPTFEESFVESILNMEKVRTAARVLHTNVYKVPGSCCGESTYVLENKSREQCFFTFYNYVEIENSLWIRELHFV